jgi:hypothetical protein
MQKKSPSTRKFPSIVMLVCLLLFVFLSVRPLPKASIDNCVRHSGLGSGVLKGEGKGDIVIELDTSTNYFYINRAIDNGLSVEVLREKIVGRQIELLTISHWTPLDPLSKSKHIAQVKIDGEIVFTEL